MRSVIEIPHKLLVEIDAPIRWGPESVESWMEQLFGPVKQWFDDQPIGSGPPEFIVEQLVNQDVLRVILDDDGNDELRMLWNASVAPLMAEIMERRRG